MSQSKAAKRYAISLRDLASERGEVDRCLGDMQMISSLIGESKELDLLLKSPIIKTDKKQQILDMIIGGQASELTKSFVKIVTAKGREDLLKSIAQSYIDLVKQDRNVLVAEVTTASNITADVKAKVLEIVNQMQSGEVELVEKTDASIIGGFILKVGDKMIDASVKSKFRKLRQEFTDGSYVNSLS